MRCLDLTSVLARNTFAVTAAIGAVLDARWGDDARVRVLAEAQGGAAARGDATASSACDRLLAGDIAMGWVCGLHYVVAVGLDGADPRPNERAACELLATPVFAHERYGGQPVYFSDVIVRADDSAQALDDLVGYRWAFNESNSMSGYVAPLAELVRRGASPRGFFSAQLEVGSHAAAIDAVLARRADVAAIDSTLLDFELCASAELRRRLRVVTSLGPYPAPPWIISRALDDERRARLRCELLAFHGHSAGRGALAVGTLLRFAAVTPADYAPLAQALAQLTT